jgi:hypothetical protein
MTKQLARTGHVLSAIFDRGTGRRLTAFFCLLLLGLQIVSSAASPVNAADAAALSSLCATHETTSDPASKQPSSDAQSGPHCLYCLTLMQAVHLAAPTGQPVLFQPVAPLHYRLSQARPDEGQIQPGGAIPRAPPAHS